MNAPADRALAVRLRAIVETLCGFGPRHMSAPGNRRTIEWLVSEFVSMGYDVALQPFEFQGATMYNVHTSGENTRVAPLLLMAHFDTFRGAGADAVETPGADDNASGVAIVLEVARLLRDRGNTQVCQFLLTNLEEEGGVGAAHFAAWSRAEGRVYQAILNLDTIGIWPQPPSHDYPIQIVSDEASSLWAASFRNRFPLPSAPSAIPWQDDHAKFWEQGYVAIELTEPGVPAVMHTADDLPYNLNYEVMARITEALVQTVLEIGEADLPKLEGGAG